jgi:hypothetical protein
VKALSKQRRSRPLLREKAHPFILLVMNSSRPFIAGLTAGAVE